MTKAKCSLADVRASRFYSYSVLHQPVISTGHSFPIVGFAVISTHQHRPPRRSRFFVSFSIEVENQQLTTAEGHFKLSEHFAATQLIPGIVICLYRSTAETYRIPQSTAAEGLTSSVAHFFELQESVISDIESIEPEKSEVDRCRRSY